MDPQLSERLSVAPSVRAALARGAPVVALESALITHGFAPPRNLEVARRAEAAVRASGAVPATVAVEAGRLRVGLDDTGLEALAAARDVAKASRQNLAASLVSGRPAGTTVAATMIAAGLTGIRVFATGGIGGVHRGGERTLDVSADLDELARTPVLVVCSGPKSILDVGRTLEVLETRGVPVLGWRSDEVAGFTSRTSGHRAWATVADAAEAAAVARAHWRLGLESGLLVTVPVPDAAALHPDEARTATEQAIRDAEAEGVRGPSSTPWVLTRIAELTEGRSVDANAALIEHNAAIAAGIAAALAALER